MPFGLIREGGGNPPRLRHCKRGACRHNATVPTSRNGKAPAGGDPQVRRPAQEEQRYSAHTEEVYDGYPIKRYVIALSLHPYRAGIFCFIAYRQENNMTLKHDALLNQSVPLAGTAKQRIASLPKWLTQGAAMAGFLAAILVSNYALQGFPNVKLFDLLVFLAGYSLGFRKGAIVAAAAWLVYGTFNPFGPSGPMLLGVEMASEMAYALAGALARRLVEPGKVRLLPSKASVFFAVTAVASTLAYDVGTNLYTGYSWATLTGSTEYGRWIWVSLTNPGALYFMAAHLSSNVVFFAAAAPLGIVAARRLGR